MDSNLPQIYLIRHGKTVWTETHQHTGTSDIPLTEEGRKQAKNLANELSSLSFSKVFVSPLIRSIETCEIAGLLAQATITPDLMEWSYGDYEGITTREIQKTNPHWNIFKDGAPHGESPADVALRADNLIQKIREDNGTIALFSHAHFLRIFAARWLGLAPVYGAYFYLSTATISILGYEHSEKEPIVKLWNYTPPQK